jgi:hypothetical protein
MYSMWHCVARCRRLDRLRSTSRSCPDPSCARCLLPIESMPAPRIPRWKIILGDAGRRTYAHERGQTQLARTTCWMLLRQYAHARMTPPQRKVRDCERARTRAPSSCAVPPLINKQPGSAMRLPPLLLRDRSKSWSRLAISFASTSLPVTRRPMKKPDQKGGWSVRLC